MIVSRPERNNDNLLALTGCVVGISQPSVRSDTVLNSIFAPAAANSKKAKCAAQYELIEINHGNLML
jgi:hypothetical protein